MLDIDKLSKEFRRNTFLKIIMAFYDEKRRKLRELLFSDLKRITKLSDGTLGYYLNKLIALGIIIKDDLGFYTLKIKVPFSYLFEKLPPCTYIGLLGLRNHRIEPEPYVALDLLESNGIKIEDKYVFTTQRAINSWGLKKLRDLKLIILDEGDLLTIPKIEEKIMNLIIKESIIRPIILDCTSLTKTATIAMYNIARKYLIPLIYIYEQTRELYWIIHMNEIRNEILRILS